MKRLVFVSDIHTPYHDVRAVDLVLKVLHQIKPDILVHGGDHWDFWRISRFEKQAAHKRHSLLEELKIGLDVLQQFGHAAPESHFIEGNHDDRISRDLAGRAPEYMEVLEHFKLDLPGIVAGAGFKTYTPYRKHLTLGKVIYSHDLGRAGEYAVHQSGKDAHHNIVIGHNHIMDYTVGGNSVGKSKVAASFGWLGDINRMDYRSKLTAMRQWSLGFGVGYMLERGVTIWTPVPIVDYRCVVEGFEFKA